MSPNDLRELAQELIVALEGLGGVVLPDRSCPLTIDDAGDISACDATLCPVCAARKLADALADSTSPLAAALGRELLQTPRGRCEGGCHA